MAEQGFRIWTLGGLPIIASPAEIDIANAHKLRETLLAAGDTEHATVVLDMTQNRVSKQRRPVTVSLALRPPWSRPRPGDPARYGN
jgi:hypothetical protein